MDVKEMTREELEKKVMKFARKVVNTVAKEEKLTHELRDLKEAITNAPTAYAVKDTETGELSHLSGDKIHCVTQCLGTDLKFQVVTVKLLEVEGEQD